MQDKYVEFGHKWKIPADYIERCYNCDTARVCKKKNKPKMNHWPHANPFPSLGPCWTRNNFVKAFQYVKALKYAVRTSVGVMPPPHQMTTAAFLANIVHIG